MSSPTLPASHRRLPPRTFAWISALALAAACLAPRVHASATKSSASGDESRQLRVVLAEPVGEQQELYEISASFDAPMVRLGERGRTERKGPIRFDPSLRGTFTWLGTATVSFQPEAPPAPGTRVTCTIPAGTRSLSGARLAADRVWTIEYRRPRLLAAVPHRPHPVSGRAARPAWGTQPLDDPFLFAFDRPPSAGAARAIRVRGPQGELKLQSIPVEPAHLAALFGRAAESHHPEQVIALRADAPLLEDTEYTVAIPAGVEFPGSMLGLAAPVEYAFRSLGPLRVEMVLPDDGGIAVEFTAPVDPDSFLALVRLTPRPRDLAARRSWGGRGGVRLSGAFPPGRPVAVEIPPETTDLFGRRLGAPFSATVEMPHADPILALFPSTGVLMPDPDPRVQVRARNVLPVRMRAAWVLSSEMPRYVAAQAEPRPGRRGRRGSPPVRSRPWESRRFELPAWDAPALFADSLCEFRRELARIGPPPPGAHALLFEVEAIPRFPDDPAWSDTLREESLVRVSPVGISCTLGEESGLLWVTDLTTGRSVANAAVSIWPAADSSGAAPAALWRGRTDADGLASTPGRHLLAPRGMPRLVLAETPAGSSWLELTVPWRPTPRGFDLPDGGFLFTDRPIYRPGETLRWKGYVRGSDARGLHPVRALPVRAVLQLGERQLTSEHVLAGSGNADGSFALPPTARPGITPSTSSSASPTARRARSPPPPSRSRRSVRRASRRTWRPRRRAS